MRVQQGIIFVGGFKMIECSCGRKRASIKFELKSYDRFFDCILNVIYDTCPCGKFIVELTRNSKKFGLQTITRYGKEAYNLYDKLEKSIVKQIEKSTESIVDKRWYLIYNKFGVADKCYSNLSTLKIGRVDTSKGYDEFARRKKYLQAS